MKQKIASDIDFPQPLQMKDVISAIERGQVFSALKLCHGFWELGLRFQDELERLNEEETGSDIWAELLEKFRARWPAEMYLELMAILRTAEKWPRTLVLASELGWKGGREIEGTPIVGYARTRQFMFSSISREVSVHDGLFWKNAVIDGSYAAFLESARSLRVLVVGPEYVRHFADFARFSRSDFIVVDGRVAAWFRHEIKDSIRKYCNRHRSENVVCLLEVGGATSAWLAARLSREVDNAWFLAMGQVLNICNFSRLEGVNWYMVYRDQINKTIDLINPDWKNSPVAYGDMLHEQSDFPLLRASVASGQRYSLLNIINKAKKAEPDKVCRFIECKNVDKKLYDHLLEFSAASNHWANFGPVSRLLEESLQQEMAVADGREVVVCKSATDAIFALVGMHELKAGRKLKWVVSAFGFYSTRLGPLSDATVLDCDQGAMLDVAALRQLDDEDWDAVIVTNVFGLCRDISPWHDLCRERGKLLLMDNAMAFHTETRQQPDAPDECVSFHHTKPWGIGEGGCAVVASEDVELFRSLINFGARAELPARPYALNSKLSDYDSALILQRIINIPNWQRLYRLQARRIIALGTSLGLQLLGENPTAIMGHIPFLADRPILKKALENPYLILRKYYKPLQEGLPVADGLFERIINVPCHPDVAAVSDDDILSALKMALEGSR